MGGGSLNEPAARAGFRQVWGDIAPLVRPSALGFAGIVVQRLLTLAAPVLVGGAIDAAQQRDTGRLQVLVAANVAIGLASIGLVYLEWRQVGAFAMGYLRHLRRVLAGRIFALDLDFFTHERSGRLVSRLTSDVENVQQFAEGGLGIAIRAVLTLALTLVVMGFESWRLTLAVVTLAVPLIVASAWFRSRSYAAQLEVRERMARLLTRLNESLAGMRVIQAYSVEDASLREFEAQNRGAYEAKIATARLSIGYYPVVEFLNALSLAIVLGYGSWLAASGTLRVGVVIAFVMLTGLLFEPVQQLTELNSVLQAAAASFARIFWLRAQSPQLVSRPDARPLEPRSGAVRIERLAFAYGSGPRVLDGIDLDLRPGERVALVGASGAGKSTLAKLIPRFYDPVEGRVLIDGQDVREVELTSLRRAVALIPQEGFLFDGTVAGNIAAASPTAGIADVEAACAELGILDRLQALPDGLDTEVTNRGLSLSAGQRQLVALARAHLAGPRVLILDEATSNVDPATEHLVEIATQKVQRNRTSLVIAHRVATALRAERVVMMAGGRIVEDGPPQQLVEADGYFAGYARLARAAG